MNIKHPFLCMLVLICFSHQAWAQTDQRVDSFDVSHYRIQLSIRDLQAQQIRGTARLTITSKRDSLAEVRLDLRGLQVTAIQQHNDLCAFTRRDDMLFIQLPQALQTGDTTSLSISYFGKPVTDAKWGGFFFSGNYAYNMGVGMASVPPTFGRCWYPCVDNFTERATYEFVVTTDTGFTAACGGILQSQTVQADSVIWHWKLNQTIPTYLSSVAVGKYVFVKYIYDGIAGSYPVWLAAIPADTIRLKQSFATLNQALQCFEEKFGPQQFDRVGYAAVPFNAGAMEHAANIAYPLYAIDGTLANETLMAHELAHSWFGNLVTCSSAEDMWLNEGWASYCEAVYLECMYGTKRYLDFIFQRSAEVNLQATSNDNGWQPVSGVPSVQTYGTHVYRKGSLVVHNLRTYMGDSAFFAACKSYLLTYPFSHASSDTLKRHFQSFTSRNLDEFFQYWVYEPGHVGLVVAMDTMFVSSGNQRTERYRIEENNRYKTGIHSSLPVVLELHHPDTVVRIPVLLENGEATYTYSYPISLQPVWAYTANTETGLVFGHNMESTRITGKGVVTLNQVLVSLNVQDVSVSPVSVCVEHHWTPPQQPFDLFQQGIRISKERYWRVQGDIAGNIQSWAFFSYNGMPQVYLDAELMAQLQSEDSLVLLYRPLGGTWSIHTDHTFQPGGNKTDKSGRFWVTQLKAGEYTFGVRDATAVGVSDITSMHEHTVYIYPNPSSGWIHINITQGSSDASVTVYDMMGKRVTGQSLTLGENKLRLPHGTYIIEVKQQQSVVTKKVVVCD